MLIHGKERRFKLTVGAAAEIAEMCPDGDLRNVGKILEGNYSRAILTVAKMMVALSRGYEEAMEYEQNGYVAEILELKELLTLEPHEFAQIREEALLVFNRDSAPSVQVEESKKKVE